MFDMGPYYLTALVTLIGRIRRVTGSAQISFLRTDRHESSEIWDYDPRRSSDQYRHGD